MKRIRFNEKSNIGFFDGARKKEEEEEEEEEEVEEEGKKIIFPSFPKIFDGYSKNLTLSYYTVLNYTPQLPYPIPYLLFTYQRDRFENFARHSRSW